MLSVKTPIIARQLLFALFPPSLVGPATGICLYISQSADCRGAIGGEHEKFCSASSKDDIFHDECVLTICSNCEVSSECRLCLSSYLPVVVPGYTNN